MEKENPSSTEQAKQKKEKARLFRLFSETGSILDYLEYSRLRGDIPKRKS
jgi:hypothetical protein